MADGTVIESGEGEPSREVQEKMERFVGFDHKGMLDIANAGAARLLATAVGRGRGGELERLWKELLSAAWNA